jgi:prevent-host-death family protein
MPVQSHVMRTEPVTTLKRQATELIDDVERSGEPILITQHGRPAAYLVDVATWDLMCRRMRILEGIGRGEMAAASGRIVSHDEARNRMSRFLR